MPASAIPEDGDGWVAHPNATPLADRLEFEDLEFLGHFTHPLRGALLRRLKAPASAAELADQLAMPVTRLYHHLNQLDAAGMIQVVATRQVGARIQRRYQVTGRSLAIAPSFFDAAQSDDIALALGSLFDFAKHGFQAEIEAGAFDGVGDLDEHSVLSLNELALTPVEHAELVTELVNLIERFATTSDAGNSDATERHRFTLFVAGYPLS